MKKIILALLNILKSLIPCEKPKQKAVLEKVCINKPFKKKNASSRKKTAKGKKCQK